MPRRWTKPGIVAGVGAALVAGLAVASTGAAQAAPPTCDGRVATIVGTEGNDIIKLTQADDVVVGLGGNDNIAYPGRFGGMPGPPDASNDVVCGGAGDDTIGTSDGSNRIFGEDGNDFVSTGNGPDLLVGADGYDTLQGGGGNDDLSGGSGNDRIEGWAGDDFINGGIGSTARPDFDGCWGGSGIFTDISPASQGDRITNCEYPRTGAPAPRPWVPLPAATE